MNTHQHLTETTQYIPDHENHLYSSTSTVVNIPKMHYDDSYQNNDLNSIANYKTDAETLNNLITTSTTTSTAAPITSSTSESPPILNGDIFDRLNNTSLQLLLRRLQADNYLPKTFTTHNLDNSMRTLAKILFDLKKAQHLNSYKQKPNLSELDNVASKEPSKSYLGKISSLLKFI